MTQISDGMLAEIDAIIKTSNPYPLREHGDIDAGQLMERYGYGKSKADRTLEMLGKQPGWVRLKIFDPESKRAKWVVRRRA